MNNLEGHESGTEPLIAHCEANKSLNSLTETMGLDGALSDAAQFDLRSWWVVHTKPRQEKVLADDLKRQRILYFLPLVRANRAYCRKRVTVELPLFPSYVFLFASPSDREAALKTNRVAATIPVHDQFRLRFELRQIHRLLDSGEAVSLYPSLKTGSHCRVTVGPLKGICGVVIGTRRKRKFYVSVTTLGLSATLEIDAAWLEPIDIPSGTLLGS
ncbi:MAG: hypothetical protein B6D36_09205 [Planctomycetes bacterium UTPLA1]|jgi:transcriptional antiterminator RfaH|nr:MAG: hypothetical protein B6D36_09205 [Planctomycetes bacterium UTPLA1]